MNRGTFCGDIAEIKFVKLFNSDKLNPNFKEYLDNIKYENINQIFMVRVTGKQYSKLSNQVVMTRADTYLIKSKDSKINEILKENEYYLDEKILEKENISYKCIQYSGISIKMTDSDKYQILKLTPDSFYKLFNEYELGAGASIYCQKEEELIHFSNDPQSNIWVLSTGSHPNDYADRVSIIPLYDDWNMLLGKIKKNIEL